jgi:hypothetical protein
VGVMCERQHLSRRVGHLGFRQFEPLHCGRNHAPCPSTAHGRLHPSRLNCVHCECAAPTLRHDSSKRLIRFYPQRASVHVHVRCVTPAPAPSRVERRTSYTTEVARSGDCGRCATLERKHSLLAGSWGGAWRCVCVYGVTGCTADSSRGALVALCTPVLLDRRGRRGQRGSQAPCTPLSYFDAVMMRGL